MSELSQFESSLRERASDRCELCGAEQDLGVLAVGTTPSSDRCVLACASCRAQSVVSPLDAKHWFCLREAAWSEVAAVQVHSYRLLGRLAEQGEAWAGELRDQLYLDEDTLAWAQAEPESGAGEAGPRTLDSNGVELADGDSVTLIKDLDVKGGGFVAKRGTVVKGIRLTGDPEHIEGRVNKVALVLKTRFLKKV